LRALKEFPCTKCKAKIPIPQELKDELAAAAKAEAEKAAEAAPIPFTCAKCGTKMTVKAALAGKKVRCKSCREVNTVPTPEEEAEAEAPPPLPKTEQPAAPEKEAEPAPSPEDQEAAEPAPASEEPKPESATEDEPGPAIEDKPEPSKEEEPEAVEEPKTQDKPAASSPDAERLATLEKELHELRDEVAELKCIIAEYTDSQSEASARAATALEELARNGPR